MIPVTPIAGRTILLDADKIEAIEVTPATVIVLTDHQRMVVTDEAESVVASIGKARAARLASVARLKRTRNADVIPFRPRAVAG